VNNKRHMALNQLRLALEEATEAIKALMEVEEQQEQRREPDNSVPPEIRKRQQLQQESARAYSMMRAHQGAAISQISDELDKQNNRQIRRNIERWTKKIRDNI